MTTTKSPKTKRSGSCGTQASTQKSHPFGNGLPGSGLKSAHSERACNPARTQKKIEAADPTSTSQISGNMPSSPRRFPPPWTIEELNDACFVVSDANGQKLAYVYFEDEPGRRRAAANLLRRGSKETVIAAFLKAVIGTVLWMLVGIIVGSFLLDHGLPTLPKMERT